MRSIVSQNQIKDEILKERLALAGQIMQECDVEAWMILSREYNEDPLFHALTPSRFPTARRITILVLSQKNGVCTNYCVNMHDEELEKFYIQDYKMNEETQMQALERVLRKINPNKIAINISEHYAYTDGLSVGLYRMLCQELPQDLVDRFVSSDELGIRLLESRCPLEIKYYPEVMNVAIEIIEKTFSNETIEIGKTTCDDLVHFMEQEVNNRGIVCWFEPTINLQRADGRHDGNTIIQRGDLLHCDFGITYLNICTDTQRLCYVLKEDETDLPTELKEAMKRNNHFQDIVRSYMKIGRSGNDVFEMSINKAKEEGLRPMLYTHPCGFHGHGAGPDFGLFSNQNRLPIIGERIIHNYTSFALELNTCEYLEMYQRDTYLFTEETVILIDDEVHFIAPGREHIYLVK